jgi:quercetin dioxygenase-like cupin family protein
MTQQTDQMEALNPLAVSSEEGEARWWFGALAVIKATAADTGGLMSIVEVTEHPGAEAPLHVHHRDDEGFWILEGDVTFEVGDTTIVASAGDYVYAPREIPHRFTVGDRGCRMLFVLVPGGIEDVIRATSAPAPSRTLPPPPEAEPTPEEVERLTTIVKEHGYELLRLGRGSRKRSGSRYRRTRSGEWWPTRRTIPRGVVR